MSPNLSLITEFSLTDFDALPVESQRKLLSLIDRVALSGDVFDRISAWEILLDVGFHYRDTFVLGRVFRIIETFANAQDFMDTISVSQSLAAFEKFLTLKMVASQLVIKSQEVYQIVFGFNGVGKDSIVIQYDPFYRAKDAIVTSNSGELGRTKKAKKEAPTPQVRETSDEWFARMGYVDKRNYAPSEKVKAVKKPSFSGGKSLL